jgi:lipoprotein-releasing system ATP-binding protein
MPLLEAKQIRKNFDDLAILDGIDLSVNAGESLAIVGASGEGKSTLLHILGTLEPPTSGTVLVDGEVATSSNAAFLRSRKIGFVFQHFHLLEEYTVLENVLMPARIAGDPLDVDRARALLTAVGLESRAHAAAKQLSGGEKQRAALARALCNDPPLILADEPSGNLDHKNAAMIHDLLLSLTKSKTLVVVTHNLNFAKRCARTLLLSSGKVTAQ